MASRRSFLRRLLGAPVAAAAAAVIVPEILKAEPAPLAPVRFGMVTDEVLEDVAIATTGGIGSFEHCFAGRFGSATSVADDHPALTS